MDVLNPMTCPLCGESTVRVLEKISSAELAGLYADFLGESITHLFNGNACITKHGCTSCGLIFFYPHVAGDEAFYRSLSAKKFYYPSQKDEYVYSLKFINDEDRVLDIGCGAGEFGSYVAQYTGIDINAKALSVAKQRGLNVCQESIEAHIRQNAARYDVICAFQVLEHIDTPRAFLTEMVKGLKEGGRIVISVPSAESFIAYSQNHLLNLPPHHLTWWPDAALESLGRILPLDLLEMYHEPVQDVHLESYIITLYTQILNSLLPFMHHTVRARPTLPERARNKLALILSRKTARLFQSAGFRPMGHTVTAVYKRRKGELASGGRD